MDEPTSAAAASKLAQPRNLVVCCDGTGNMWGNQHDTNVVKLVRWCVKDERQLVYYDPGVGSADAFPTVSWSDRLKYKLDVVAGLAFGRGIYENVAQAYEFLVHNYRSGDRIFLFGFSRGAFTVRCVSGLVQLFGIVRPCAEPMLPLLLRSYFSDKQGKRAEFAEDVRKHFTDTLGAEAPIHFIGVWDTVETVGGLRQQRISSDPGLYGKRFNHVRHAISQDEYRHAYAPRLYKGENQDTPSGLDDQHQPSLKQLWFAGIHSDVGGSYAQSGLSDITLEWMMHEAGAQELRFDPLVDPKRPPLLPNPLEAAHDQALVSPLWALVGLERRPEPPARSCHPSLLARRKHAGLRLSPRLPLLAHGWFWASLLASALLYALTVGLTVRIGPVPVSAIDLGTMQLLAPMLSESVRLQHRLGLRLPLLADCLFVLAYTCSLCVLCVHSLRALRVAQPSDKPARPLSYRWSAWPLRTVLAADLLENLCTWEFFTRPTWRLWGVSMFGAHSVCAWLLAICSAAKWLAIASLLALFGYALGYSLLARLRRANDTEADASDTRAQI